MAQLSVNQLVSETRKAALGKGYHFGVADDLARAVQWLAAFAHVPSAELLALMNAPSESQPQKPEMAQGDVVMPEQAGLLDVMAALDFSEAYEAKRLVIKAPFYPALTLALIALRASPAAGQFFATDGRHLSDALAGLDGDMTLVKKAYQPDVPSQFPARISIADDTYEMLKKMAYETYVPSSEKSRAAGAGAGLNDND